MILDHWIEEGRGAECNIIVTQPRRISAISLAKRVAKERNEGVSEGGREGGRPEWRFLINLFILFYFIYYFFIKFAADIYINVRILCCSIVLHALK